MTGAIVLVLSSWQNVGRFDRYLQNFLECTHSGHVTTISLQIFALRKLAQTVIRTAKAGSLVDRKRNNIAEMTQNIK